MPPAPRPDAPTPGSPVRRGVRAWPAWSAPTGVAAVVVGATVALAVRSPHVSGSWGVCPSLLLTGMWCPACGGLRAVHELTQGDLGAAFAMNPAVVVGLPLAAVVWLWWLLGTLGRRPEAGPFGAVGALVSTRAGWVFLGLAVVFGVLRNVPGLETLAPV